MTKTLKKNKGFTLTELIVVIVIIGILAAVLIPSLTGYIQKAKNSAAEQEATSYVTMYATWKVERDDLPEAQKVNFKAYCDELLGEDTAITTTTGTDLTTQATWDTGFVYTASNGLTATYDGSKITISK